MYITIFVQGRLMQLSTRQYHLNTMGATALHVHDVNASRRRGGGEGGWLIFGEVI